MRKLLFGRIEEYDTEWGCYVWWGDVQLTGKGETREWWGAGRFLDLYPCRERLCIIAGAPVQALRPDQSNGRSERLRAWFASIGAPINDLFAGSRGWCSSDRARSAM
ncbi:MAG TPA: hypothetical protein VFB54_13090 [Burkholderiales bacterium]|nr:hypothetical protein [Burkholderiales bacterium]